MTENGDDEMYDPSANDGKDVAAAVVSNPAVTGEQQRPPREQTAAAAVVPFSPLGLEANMIYIRSHKESAPPRAGGTCPTTAQPSLSRQRAVRSLCLSQDGGVLCAGFVDGTLLMYDFVATEDDAGDVSGAGGYIFSATRSLTPFPHRVSGFQSVVALAFAPGGQYFVAAPDGNCPVLVKRSGKTMDSCALGQPGMTDVVRCQGHKAAVTSTEFLSAAPDLFITGSADATARVWNAERVKSGSVYAARHGISTNSFAQVLAVTRLSGSSSLFMTAGNDGIVQAWDSRVPYRPQSHCGMINVADAPQIAAAVEVSVAGAGGGSCVALRCDDATVRLYDTRLLRSKAAKPATSSANCGGGGIGTQELAARLEGMPFLFETSQLSAASAKDVSGATISGLVFTADRSAVFAKVSSSGFSVVHRIDVCREGEAANGVALCEGASTTICGTQNGSLRAFVTSASSPLLRWKLRKEAGQSGNLSLGRRVPRGIDADASDDVFGVDGRVNKVQRVELQF